MTRVLELLLEEVDQAIAMDEELHIAENDGELTLVLRTQLRGDAITVVPEDCKEEA